LEKYFFLKKLFFLFVLVLFANCKTLYVRLTSAAKTLAILNNTDSAVNPTRVLDILLKGEQLTGKQLGRATFNLTLVKEGEVK
jgi:hypothetical protein